MMTIVINQREGSRDAAIRILNRNITPLCKAPAYALKFCQAALDVFVLNARQGRDRDRRQGIAHIMYARQVQYDGKRRMIGAKNRKTHARAIGRHINCANGSVMRKTVPNHGFRYARTNRANVIVVHAEHGYAVKRQTSEKVHKSTL